MYHGSLLNTVHALDCIGYLELYTVSLLTLYGRNVENKSLPLIWYLSDTRNKSLKVWWLDATLFVYLYFID
jgi:hypothetical protein